MKIKWFYDEGTKYKCTKAFSLPKLDGDWEEEIGSMYVRKGSVWEKTDNNHLGADIHLEHCKNGDWIEITKEMFEECFENVK